MSAAAPVRRERRLGRITCRSGRRPRNARGGSRRVGSAFAAAREESGKSDFARSEAFGRKRRRFARVAKPGRIASRAAEVPSVRREAIAETHRIDGSWFGA